MRTGTEEALSRVAVEAEHLNVLCRVTLSLQCTVERRAQSFRTTGLLASINMINRKKLGSTFFATNTFTSVSLHRLFFQLLTPFIVSRFCFNRASIAPCQGSSRTNTALGAYFFLKALLSTLERGRTVVRSTGITNSHFRSFTFKAALGAQSLIDSVSIILLHIRLFIIHHIHSVPLKGGAVK